MRTNINSSCQLRLKFGRAILLLLPLLFVWPALFMRSQHVDAQVGPPPTPKRMLVLTENERAMAGREGIDQAFQSVIQSAPPGSIESYDETLELYRFPGERHILLMHDYIQQKYAGMKLDLIVARTDPALQFVLRYRDDLFPGVPIVYLSTTRPFPNQQPPATTGLWGAVKRRDTVEIALQLQPDTKEIFVISGRTTDTSAIEMEIRNELKEFENRVTIHYLFGRPFDELIATVRNLPERSIVFCPRLTAVVGGRSINMDQAVTILTKSSNVPVYSIVDVMVGHGIVGGKVGNFEWAGSEMAKMALRVLNGARPEDIPVEEIPAVPMFDWRQLRRFHISEDRLPAGSVVRFKEFTFWELYKGRIMVVFAILTLQTLLLVGLMFERARKRRATHRLSESEERLLQLTGQLFRSQDEERRRIARELHDGTAQNLFGISINLAKLNQLSQDKPEAKRLIDECESLGNESLQEIRTLSYLLHPPLLDEAGLVSALQWYVQGFTKRSGIFVDLVTQPMDRLSADVELALFRIVQESLTNVRRHSGSETASIRLENKSGEIVLEIQDRGRGMPTPKMSEDAHDLIEVGVGIPGMRQRLVQLGGRLEVTSNHHGATITAVVPLTNGALHAANPSRGRS